MKLSENELKQLFEHIPLYKMAFFYDLPYLEGQYENLNLTHIHVIMYLNFHGEDMLSGIARFLHLEKGSFTPVANRMIDWGLAEKVKQTADRRMTVLRLTEQGRQAAQQIQQEQLAFFDKQINRLTATERKQLFSMLDKMHQLLRKISPEE